MLVWNVIVTILLTVAVAAAVFFLCALGMVQMESDTANERCKKALELNQSYIKLVRSQNGQLDSMVKLSERLHAATEEVAEKDRKYEEYLRKFINATRKLQYADYDDDIRTLSGLYISLMSSGNGAIFDLVYEVENYLEKSESA